MFLQQRHHLVWLPIREMAQRDFMLQMEVIKVVLLQTEIQLVITVKMAHIKAVVRLIAQEILITTMQKAITREALGNK